MDKIDRLLQELDREARIREDPVQAMRDEFDCLLGSAHAWPQLGEGLRQWLRRISAHRKIERMERERGSGD